MQNDVEKRKILFLWEQTLIRFYENDSELFDAKAQERTIAGKLAMHMNEIYRKIFPEENLVIDIEYNRSGENKKPNFLSKKERSWTAPDIVLHKRMIDDCNIFCCEMKKDSDAGKYDAKKVKSLIYHRNYHYGVDLYKINRNEAKFTLYYLSEKYRWCEKEEYCFDPKENRLTIVKR